MVDPGPLSFEPWSGLKYIALTGVTDGNTNDGREKISFTVTSRHQMVSSQHVKYEQGSDTAQLIFSPRGEGQDTLDLVVSDDFGTDLGGTDRIHLVIPVHIESTANGIPATGHTEVQLYPNPAGDQIRLVTGQQGITLCELYDISGRKLMETRHISANSVKVISLANYENGLYIFKLYGFGSEVQIRKIIIKK